MKRSWLYSSLQLLLLTIGKMDGQIISMIYLTVLKLYPKHVGICEDYYMKKDLIQWVGHTLIMCCPELSLVFNIVVWILTGTQPSLSFPCFWLPKPWWLVFVSLIELSLVHRVLTASTLSICIEVFINNCVELLAPYKS